MVIRSSHACSCSVLFFFFKQKTSYEMRISDWSSDVCSSDLLRGKEVAVSPVPKRRKHSENLSSTVRCIEQGHVSARPPHGPTLPIEIGRASCRERVCQYV